MKFSKQLDKIKARSHWGGAYINYRRLKGIVKTINYQLNVANQLDLAGESMDEFWASVQQELDNCSGFILEKLTLFKLQLDDLSRGRLATSSDMDEETALLRSRRQHSLTFGQSEIDDLKKLNRHLKMLVDYQEMNTLGLRKIVKKYDKITGHNRLAGFLEMLHNGEVIQSAATCEAVSVRAQQLLAEAMPTKEYHRFIDEMQRRKTSTPLYIKMIYEHKLTLVLTIVLLILCLLSYVWLQPSFKNDPSENWQAYAVMIGTYFAFVLILYGKPVDAVLFGLATMFMILGIITAEQMFAGFTNEGVLVNGVLFIFARGLTQSGVVESLCMKAMGQSPHIWIGQLRMMVIVALVSSCLNNTPIVAMMIPVIETWCARMGQSVSKFMMPLSFASLLGGNLTLVGSSVNIVTFGIAKVFCARDKIPFHIPSFFSPAWVGVPLCVVGIGYMVLCSPYLLSDRSGNTSNRLHNKAFKLPYVFLVPFIVQDSRVGQRVDKSGLLRYTVHSICGMALEDMMTHTFKAGDVVVMMGTPEEIRQIRNMGGLSLSNKHANKLAGDRRKRSLAVAVLGPESHFVGQSISLVDIRRTYNVAVLDVCKTAIPSSPLYASTSQSQTQGPNPAVSMSVSMSASLPLNSSQNGIENRAHNPFFHHEKFMPGDALLLDVGTLDSKVFSTGSAFSLYVTIPDSAPPRSALLRDKLRMLTAVIGVCVMVVCSATGVLPILDVSCLVVVSFLSSGLVTAGEAWKSINGSVLFVIASSFAIGEAMSHSGLSGALGHGIVVLAMGNGVLTMAYVYLVVLILGLIINNTACAVLVYPVAHEAVKHANITVLPMAYLLITSASSSFVSPMSYQTNQMVMGPGRYDFKDFFKFGVPLKILTAVVSILVIHFLYTMGIYK